MTEERRKCMGVLVKTSDLCESERELVELLHELRFGRIEDLPIRDGKPVFNPPPRVIATLSMTADVCREETHGRDFAIKRPIVMLLLRLRQIQNGKILVIHVRHGLPITVHVEYPVVDRPAVQERK